MTLDELTNTMFMLTLPCEKIPGYTFPEAINRCYGLIIGQYLGVSDEELLEDLFTAEVPSSDHMDIGRAFAAAMLRSSGNAYASARIIDTLKNFSGREVEPAVGKLLKVLEHYLIRSGDVKPPSDGEETSH